MQKGAVSADKSTEVDKAVEKEEGVYTPLLMSPRLQARLTKSPMVKDILCSAERAWPAS